MAWTEGRATGQQICPSPGQLCPLASGRGVKLIQTAATWAVETAVLTPQLWTGEFKMGVGGSHGVQRENRIKICCLNINLKSLFKTLILLILITVFNCLNMNLTMVDTVYDRDLLSVCFLLVRAD